MAKDTKVMRFKCTKCGKCCRDPNTFVNLTFLDVKLLSMGLKAGVQDILDIVGFYTYDDRDYERLIEQLVFKPIQTERGKAFLGLLRTEDGRCIFLRNDDTCSIYPYRPKICRTFPFSYALEEEGGIKSKMDLIYTAKGIEYCPGISPDAPVVKKRKILKLLDEFLLELNADIKVVDAWNDRSKHRNIARTAGNYIKFILNFAKKLN